MAFVKKEWKDRIAGYINRRRLTYEDGSTELVEVARDEGTISQEGDAFNAETMNDLERRVSAGFEEVEGKVSIHNFTADETILSFAVANKANRVMGFITNASVPSDSPTTEECFVIIERDTGGDRMAVRLKPYNGFNQWEYQRSIWHDAWREDKWILKEYLQLTGGTMSGNINMNNGGIYPIDGNVYIKAARYDNYISNLFDDLFDKKATMGTYPYFVGITLGTDGSKIPYIYTGDDNIIFRYVNSAGETSFKDMDHIITTHMITVSGNEIILEWL